MIITSVTGFQTGKNLTG